MAIPVDDRQAAGGPWLRHYPEGSALRAPIVPIGLPALFDQAVARFPTRPCLDFLDKHYTYDEIGRLVDRAAKGLQGLGVVRGTRVGLFLPNTPFFVIAYYGVLKAGGTVVNYNPLYAEREVARQIEDSETEVMITLDLKVLSEKVETHLGRYRLARMVVCRMADALPFPKNYLFPMVKWGDLAAVGDDDRHIPWSRLLDNDGRPAPVVIDPDRDPAVLQYTGGTTGAPKGAVLTHANLTANTEQTARWVSGARPGEERVLGVLPLFHVFAMTVVMNLGIRLGSEMILLPRFDLDQVMAVINRKKPTMFPAVPTIYTAINNHRHLDRYDLTSILYCISGGAPLPLEVKQTFERLTGCVLVEGYGLTESGPVVCCNPLHGQHKPGSIGIPLPETVMEVISLEDGHTPLPPGERGELCVRGPQVMREYWHRPDDTADVFRHGRLHTGDVGVMDADGYFYIVDRIKDLILCSGFNVYPRNVEEAIYLHPQVEECVVAGLPDPYRGQTVKAFIKLVEGGNLTAEELQVFLRDKLSPIEIPKQVEFRPHLPRTLIGKLSRKALLDEEKERAGATQAAA